jgi:hypothetical protein
MRIDPPERRWKLIPVAEMHSLKGCYAKWSRSWWNYSSNYDKSAETLI